MNILILHTNCAKVKSLYRMMIFSAFENRYFSWFQKFMDHTYFKINGHLHDYIISNKSRWILQYFSNFCYSRKFIFESILLLFLYRHEEIFSMSVFRYSDSSRFTRFQSDVSLLYRFRYQVIIIKWVRKWIRFNNHYSSLIVFRLHWSLWLSHPIW